MRKPVLVLLASIVLCLAIGGGSALAASPAVQAAGQAASTQQSAGSSASAQQTNPSNSVVDIRIGSPGNSGSVDQSNANGATSQAANQASTGQAASQGGGSGGGVQSADQSAGTHQAAESSASGVQVSPSNEAIRIRIHSPGSDGATTQSNENGAKSSAANAAATRQEAAQGGGSGGGGVQNATQKAGTEQSAGSDATARQEHPSNSATRIRINSAGDDGDVTQRNANGATSSAANEAATGQSATQGGGSGGGVQYANQSAGTRQSADAHADATQVNPSNSVNSVRLSSPGNDGDITQSNENGSRAEAGNRAATMQGVAQGGGSGGSGVQTSDQSAATGQSASAHSDAMQCCASNSVSPVRMNSAGNGGSVNQSNRNGSEATAGNTAATQQTAAQTGSGSGTASTPSSGCSSCGTSRQAAAPCSSCASSPGQAVQASGQSANTQQSASAHSDATQTGASNSVSPVRVNSPGNEGSTTQSNQNGSNASAGNQAATIQQLVQAIAGLFTGTVVQAVGQDATTGQSADSHGNATQSNPSNASCPVWLYSAGDGGSATQSNANGAMSAAGNLAGTLQLLQQLV